VIGDSIRLGQVLSDVLVGLYFEGDKGLWSRGKLRKSNKCVACWSPLKTGEYAYAPMGSKLYRSRRICCACVEQIIREGVVWENRSGEERQDGDR